MPLYKNARLHNQKNSLDKPDSLKTLEFKTKQEQNSAKAEVYQNPEKLDEGMRQR